MSDKNDTKAEKEDPRSPEEIEAEIQRTRLAMQSTVNEIVDRLDPKKQAKNIADKAKESATDLGNRASATVTKAKEGDPSSLAIVASAASGVALLVGLALLKRGRK